MEKFERNGVVFTRFIRDGIQFTTYVRNGYRVLATGPITGEIEFAFEGEFQGYEKVVGASSLVFGGEDSTLEQLYSKWKKDVEFEREVLGIEF